MDSQVHNRPGAHPVNKYIVMSICRDITICPGLRGTFRGTSVEHCVEHRPYLYLRQRSPGGRRVRCVDAGERCIQTQAKNAKLS